MIDRIVLNPSLPWPLIAALAALALVVVGISAWRGLAGWWLRGLAAICLLAAILQPSLQRENRRPLSDIVLLVVDESASQGLSDRLDQTRAAVARIEAEVAALPNTELRKIVVGDGADDTGTALMTALAQALAEEPRARVAGAILVTDGQVHDLQAAPPFPAPVNVLLTGSRSDWDRRLKILAAPTYGIIGERVELVLRIEEQGAVPSDLSGRPVEVSIALDGGEALRVRAPVGEDLTLPLVLDHAGQNVVQIEVAADPSELTDRNNIAVVQINGVRDRLRVLLVSGEPHAGERTWRNLLKSDSAVDLVHFTILRPPEKQDGVPVSELSLIAFPTRELFIDKIDEFDLIIFDRYRLRGILPAHYLDNIRDYVRRGGAVLVAAGPEFASAESLYYSGLGEILPARPTGRVIEGGYLPEVTELGQRHPVTERLEQFRPDGGEHGRAGAPAWGRWLRQIDLAEPSGHVVMKGADGRPLLVLDRVEEGRVALLASDQAWLWDRGFEGGGPQLELLRRLAHWMMKEPELEEESLTARAEGGSLTITRRSLTDEAHEVTVTAPDGTETTLPLNETAPGRFEARIDARQIGLYRLRDGDIERVVALAPAAPREFEETIATSEKLLPVVRPTNGGAILVEDGLPALRQVRPGRPALGRGWIGITPRDAYQALDLRIAPLLPAWAFLLIAAALVVGAWLREGRR
ncbi:hypothetical protein LV82_00270 [Albidovulum inexpectatum]|uniref:Glutamine amidotransferase n=1 Tax=Albidovulum inexpectatum TaxID=196587 RepID=A0A2S5JLN5_9RHOB|nr:VWA domain-containing protein [Albidovulum inexpectatum]PPB82342.1 hypothetical protein LV82_00270 [Albidovulum inexpectatum]